MKNEKVKQKMWVERGQAAASSKQKGMGTSEPPLLFREVLP